MPGKGISSKPKRVCRHSSALLASSCSPAPWAVSPGTAARSLLAVAKPPVRSGRIAPGWSRSAPAAVILAAKPPALCRKLNFALLVCLLCSLASGSHVSGGKVNLCFPWLQTKASRLRSKLLMELLALSPSWGRLT